MEKKLKIILCITITILITIVAVFGVYSKDESGIKYESKLPDYLLSSEFEDKRITSLVIDDTETETIKDKDGNVVDSIPEGESEENYTKETTKTNPDDIRTTENFKKAKKILDGRLKSLGIDNYLVRVDENTGAIEIELSDDMSTDETLSKLTAKGDFSITDSETGEELMNRGDLKRVSVVYGQSSTGTAGVTVYIEFFFNKEGSKKLSEISKEYIKVEGASVGDIDASTPNSEESAPEATEDSTTDDASTDGTTDTDASTDETTETPTQKQITMTINGSEFLTTCFAEEMDSGELPISLGTATTDEDLQTLLDQAQLYQMLLSNDEMPLTYTIEASDTVVGNLADNGLKVALICTGIVLAAISVYSIAKYKMDGVLAVVSYLFAFALLSLMIRYTKSIVSLNSFAAVIILILVNAYTLMKVLKESKDVSLAKAFKDAYLKDLVIIIPIIIMSVVFTFMNTVSSYSFGMTLFYGAISVAIANGLILRTMLKARRD